jgi:hypothetical protein
VGGYFFGDISFVRYTSVNNIHAMYWKIGKNMADPQVTVGFKNVLRACQMKYRF